MAAVPENFAPLLEPGLRKVFDDAYKEIPSMISDAGFKVETSSKATEKYYSLGAFTDLEKFEGSVQYQDMYAGYEQSISHVQYTGGFQVERTLVEDDQYNLINSKPRGLAVSAKRTREKHAASIYNNAFSNATDTDSGIVHAGGDSLSLCNNAHTVTASSSTQDNLNTLALNATNLQTCYLAMRAFTDDRGNKILIQPDTIVVPPDLWETAYEITGTPKSLDSAEGNVNFQYKRYKVVVWDYLTDANNWFLIDSTLAKQHLHWFDRTGVEWGSTQDFDTMVAKYRIYMRYSLGFSDWRWVYGNQVG